MRLQISSILSILACTCMQYLSAQHADTASTGKKQFPIEISFFNHAVAMPFDGIVLSPVHPGFSMGTEYSYMTRKGTLYQALHAGYFHNKYVARALFLETKIGFRYTFRPGIFANVGLGVGYLHSFRPAKKIFALDKNGVYEEVKDYGKAAFTVSLCVEAGYAFGVKTDWPVSLFVRYEPLVQMPYSVESGIYPHVKQHIGFRFCLKRKK